MKHDSSGFTLIETAIVLVVIGLLLGATIKGQELINDSREKRLIGDFENIPVSIQTYQDKFRALPGDDARLAMHLPGAIPCSPLAAGKCAPGNGLIDGKWSDTSDASESYVFWQHIRLAGLADGSLDTNSSDYIPRNVLGGQLGVTSISPIIGLSGTFLICSDAIPGKYVKRLDADLDDGNTAQGFMRAVDAGTTTPENPIQITNINENSTYLVCMKV
ncbi:MAG: prepilin-type N-terminal cleavage/methylation domain-containing protein [Gallionella sp.]|nr:prepilin-type N-terminal cleavage/methylation domain-containing protein [Gallionella sp.]